MVDPHMQMWGFSEEYLPSWSVFRQYDHANVHGDVLLHHDAHGHTRVHGVNVGGHESVLLLLARSKKQKQKTII